MANLIFLGQNWAWPPCAQYSALGVRIPLKSSVMGPFFSVNCYLKIEFHIKFRLDPPLRLVLGVDTLSPTEVGTLSVAVHPDDGCFFLLLPAGMHIIYLGSIFCFALLMVVTPAVKGTLKRHPSHKGTL